MFLYIKQVCNCKKQPEVGNSSCFNGGSCYKYNFKGIGYIKLYASVYRNVWKPGLGDSMIVIHCRDT